MGKNKRIFVLYKLRTMEKDAAEKKKKYFHLNEADGPVFKIKHDPRYTKIGKILSRLGLDELPQLWNIIKGDMTFVGPRPLPVDEARRIPLRYGVRFLVLPGITSLWVVKGGHQLTFIKWMEFDFWYVKHKSIFLDIQISLQTIILIFKMVFNYLKEQGSMLFPIK